jgi:hypothetical protein
MVGPNMVHFLRAFLLQLWTLPADLLRLLLILLWTIWWILRIPFGKAKPWHPSRRVCPTDIPGHVRRKPDPCLYSQSYLLQQNVPVTWDNPDIWLTELDGTLRASSDLVPDHPYLIHGRIWDASIDPALGVQVRCIFSNWGINGPVAPVELNPDGSERVNFINISPWQNTITSFRWRTPTAPGHYCIKVICAHPDDRNTANNVGQENVLVLNAQGGTLAFLDLPVTNPFPRAVRVALSADIYAIQRAEWDFSLVRREWILGLPCGPVSIDDRRARVKWQTWLLGNQRQLAHRVDYIYSGRERLLQAQRSLAAEVPASWDLKINGNSLPQTIHLGPFEHHRLRLSLRIPMRSEHSQPNSFNCNATTADGLALGGVTVILPIE